MHRIGCVGAIITDEAGRLLLVLRGHAPEAGRWSLPGGRVEVGETDQEAVVREVREETGLMVRPGCLIGVVERPAPGGGILDIRDYAAVVVVVVVDGGHLAAGDDAAGLAWVARHELGSLPLSSGLAEALRSWGVLA